MENKENVQPQYEFTVDQNKLFASMGKKTGVISFLFFGFAVLTLAGIALSLNKLTISNMVFDGVLFVVFASIGRFNRKVSADFEKIVKTEGNDVALLMEAIASLKKLYTVQIWMFGVVFALAVLALMA